MGRTPEQKAADEALTAAIEENCRAYHEDSDRYLLHDYLIIYARIGIDDEGESVDVVGYHPRDGNFAFYRELGLVSYVKARMEGNLAHASEMEEGDGG